MNASDQKMYKTFEEFEREELRRADGRSSVVDGMIAAIYADEIDWTTPRSSDRMWDDEDEE